VSIDGGGGGDETTAAAARIIGGPWPKSMEVATTHGDRCSKTLRRSFSMLQLNFFKFAFLAFL
jgi:hypothetical protein